jgi:hypothetical protein
MQSTPFTTRAESLYFACSPELGVVSYGGCQDEALNNLAEDVRALELETGEENHAR